ncbi:MAG: Na(+)-translocating NADH-quinone reductase subunit B [Candidatus Celerinatantimonas neptuna]|nr:MAG: Na(+)-translocating NADH-quinone reductase subunit B [Candidatus Celerinatantimonas neptuna]
MKTIYKFYIAISPVVILGVMNQVLSVHSIDYKHYFLFRLMPNIIAIICAGVLFYLIYNTFWDKSNTRFYLKSSQDIIYSALIFLCLLPYHTQPIIVFGCFFLGNIISTAKIKYHHYLFYLNGALASRVILFLVHIPLIHYSIYQNDYNAITSATPLLHHAINYDLGISDKLMSIEQLFIGNWQGSIGETSKLGLIASLILLYLFKLIRFSSIIMGIIGSFLAYCLFYQSMGLAFSDFIQFIMMGGLIFGLVFMTTDLCTATYTRKQHRYYVLLIGFLCITYRAFLPFPEGMLLAIISSQLLFIVIVIMSNHLEWISKSLQVSRWNK